MACATPSPSLTLGAFRALACLLLLLPGGFSENCEAYTDFYGQFHSTKICPVYCCGTCSDRFCCSDFFQKLSSFEQRDCSDAHSLSESVEASRDSFVSPPVLPPPVLEHFRDSISLKATDMGGTVIGIVVAVSALFIVIIILCFTCSCCCLYKACRRRPRPVVTTTTATTVVQVPYPQQPGMPQGYPAGQYQGYNPVPVQPHPGVPVAPYPMQYPPPYPTQPTGPPTYHETMAGAVASQPPYNPAYMDSSKPAL